MSHHSQPTSKPQSGEDTPVTDVRRVQRRTLTVLSAALVLGSLGVAGAVAAGGLLVAEVSGSDNAGGLGQTATVFGAAVLAFPLARLSSRLGRRAGLTAGYLFGLLGAVVVVAGAAITSVPLLFLGMLLFGGALASGMQARFAATDLAAPNRIGQDLSIVLWMSAIGAVIGPTLVGPASATAETLGFPSLSGIFLWSSIAFLLAVVLLVVALRPDPLKLARREAGEDPSKPPPALGIRETFRGIRSSPLALLAFGALLTANATMVGLMVMTPLHLKSGGAGLTIVGIVISVHVAGMYLFSPLVGLLADRVGNVAVISSGIGLLAVAGFVAAATPADASLVIGAALFLLGLGWSFCLVAGSALLTESLALDLRPSAQGLADFSMGIAGGLFGALAGVIFGVWSYAVLGIVVALLVVPIAIMVVLSVRSLRRARPIQL